MQCDILCCYGSSFLDRIMAFILGDKITHVAIMYTDYIVIETTWPKTVKIDLSVFNKSRSYYILRCSILTDEQRSAISEYMNNKINTKYDILLALAIGIKKVFGIRLPFDNPHKYVCEESILEAYREAAGIVLINDEEVDICPADFVFNAPLLMIEGRHEV